MEQQPDNGIFTLHEAVLHEEDEHNSQILKDLLGISLTVTGAALATIAIGDFFLDNQFSHALQNIGHESAIVEWISTHLDHLPTALKAGAGSAMLNLGGYLRKK